MSVMAEDYEKLRELCKSLREKLDAAESACSDEEAAHKDTLRLLAAVTEERDRFRNDLFHRGLINDMTGDEM